MRAFDSQRCAKKASEGLRRRRGGVVGGRFTGQSVPSESCRRRYHQQFERNGYRGEEGKGCPSKKQGSKIKAKKKLRSRGNNRDQGAILRVGSRTRQKKREGIGIPARKGIFKLGKKTKKRIREKGKSWPTHRITILNTTKNNRRQGTVGDPRVRSKEAKTRTMPLRREMGRLLIEEKGRQSVA